MVCWLLGRTECNYASELCGGVVREEQSQVRETKYTWGSCANFSIYWSKVIFFDILHDCDELLQLLTADACLRAGQLNKEKYPLNDNCQKYYRCPKAEPRAILPVTRPAPGRSRWGQKVAMALWKSRRHWKRSVAGEKVAEQVTTQKYTGGKAWENWFLQLLCHEVQL